MSRPAIEIRVRGRLAWTYELAGERLGMSSDAVRMALKRAGVEPCAWIERVPLFYATEVRAALKGRVGRGAPGVPRPHARRES